MSGSDSGESRWATFTVALADYLGSMVDPDDEDHLLIELPWTEGEGCAPYAQFATFDGGAMLRAELSGDHYLAPAFQLDAARRRALRGRGWRGGNAEEPNWFREAPVADARRLAGSVVKALREQLRVPDPELLTYQAWGPAADGAATLGLASTEDMPVDGPLTIPDLEPPTRDIATYPQSADELREEVRAELCSWLQSEPVLDEDQDFVLQHHGQAFWVRVRLDMPAVEVMARVVHGVHSRRSTAIEIGLLNRDQPWVRWTMRDRSVWQTSMVPAWPFAAMHLRIALNDFVEQLSRTRDDLALRTGGKVA